MKTFLKILVGIVIAFFGLSIFRFYESKGFNKAVAEQGDAAIATGDFTFFQNRFEYYKEEPLIAEHIELEDDISFDLYVYHQANIKNAEGNYLTFLVHDLNIEDQAPYLKLLFDNKINKQPEDEFISIVKPGEENWYLQWIRLSMDEINDFTIHHDETLLYKYEDPKPFLSDADHDLTHFIKNENYVYGVIDELSDDGTDLGGVSQGNDLGEEILHEVDFKFVVAGSKIEEDLYLSGPFNGWDKDNESYLLHKDINDIYSTKINITSKYEKLVFKLTTSEGAVVVDENNNDRYFTYDFIDVENTDMEDYGIYKSDEPSFNQYNYYKWVAIAGYAVVVVGVGALLVFLTKPKETYVEPTYKKPNNDKDNDVKASKDQPKVDKETLKLENKEEDKKEDNL